MSLQFSERLEHIQCGIARLQKIDSMLQQLQAEKKVLSGRARELGVILDKENRDVVKLENSSLTALFHAFLGNLDERIEQERKEALVARLKYEQIKRDLHDIEERIANLAAERGQYLPYTQEIGQLTAEKNNRQLTLDDAAAQKIDSLQDKISDSQITLTEIHEAIGAGKEVLAGLEKVAECLHRAEDWRSCIDPAQDQNAGQSGRSDIDEAQNETVNTQCLLRRFRTELANIRLNRDITPETDSFRAFAERFYDGLIADWFKESKTRHSRDNVSQVKSQVLQVLNMLEEHKHNESSKM